MSIALYFGAAAFIGAAIGYAAACVMSAGREMTAYDQGFAEGKRQSPDYWTDRELELAWKTDPNWRSMACKINREGQP